MSQTVETQTPSAVLPAFRRTPINPYSAKIQQAAAALNTTPLVADQPITPVQTVQTAQMVQSGPQPAPAPAPPVPQPPMPPVAPGVPTPPPVQPPVDPRIYAALEQLEQERLRLAEENTTQYQTIQSLLAAQQELDVLKQRQQLQEALDQDGFSQLGTVDPEDAKHISNAVLNATQKLLSPLKQELDLTRRQLDERMKQQNQVTERARIQQMNQRVLSVHPDFLQLQQSPEYHNFMGQREGLSSKTRDQRAAEEFLAGNTEYVIDLLNQFKGQAPSADQILSVAPVQTASNNVTAPVPQPPPMELRELNNLYQMRQISHDVYRKKRAELRAANS